MRAPFALASVFPLAATLAAAQATPRIKVATDFADSTGIVSSAFASALRSLGDIDVVTTREDPDLVLEAVVLCQPTSCTDPESYVLAIRLYEPANLNTAMSVSLLIPPARHLSYEAALFRADTLGRRILPGLQGLQRTHMMWAARWGRLRYEEQARELVRTIDSQCFDKLRQARRAAQMRSDSAETENLQAILARHWLC